jgi:ABC-2 type transport system ATP-binding protein
LLAIETRGLTRRFGQLVAVDNLNLQVPAGSLYGLIGPNGAGKTTTLRMLAGLLEPSSGQILLNGTPLGLPQWGGSRGVQRQIGYMPDFFGVYEDMLVWEYLDFFARCYGLPSERRRRVTDELLELVDLAEKRDAYVETLSRGMRQRLCLAHALVHDPSILLLDEPASGLDPRARVEMRELLRELSAMGKTVLVSSHILAELAELCDSVGIIEKGRLVAGGPLDEITRRLKWNPEGSKGQGCTLRLKIISDRSQAEAVLRDQPGVIELRVLGKEAGIRELGDFSKDTPNPLIPASELELEFLGEEAAAADLLATLIARGVKVVSFTEVTTDLEEVFLHLTQESVTNDA